MTKRIVIVCHCLPEGELERWRREFSHIEFLDAQTEGALERAEIAYGLPDLARLDQAKSLRWIQLASAGVPHPLCAPALKSSICVTNLAGLYGPTIAEHALAMLLTLNRNLHVVQRQQAHKSWERDVANTMRDLSRKTLAIVGLGSIGASIARLARAFGMRIVGCRRTGTSSPHADRLYPLTDVGAMFAEADHIAIAAPLTRQTDGLVGLQELRCARPGAILVNVSRGPIVQEEALIEVLRNGPLGGAGLDVFAVEPLPVEHPFWAMPNVLVSPHYSGETVNLSAQPAQRFVRNLRAYEQGSLLEGLVNLEQGY